MGLKSTQAAALTDEQVNAVYEYYEEEKGVAWYMKLLKKVKPMGTFTRTMGRYATSTGRGGAHRMRVVGA